MSWQAIAEKNLIALEAPHVLTMQDLQSRARIAARAVPAPATLSRWVRALCERGALQTVTRGVYLNRLAGPGVHPAEAAQHIRRGAIVSLALVLEQCGALNNFADTVTCVVPQIAGMAPPRVGERKTSAGNFRFYAMPRKLLEAGAQRIEDVQDLRYGYPRATPERALLDWVYLGASGRSRLPPPPLDVQLRGMRLTRLRRLVAAMGMEQAWEDWHARWQRHDAAADVQDNASRGLGF